MQIRKRIIRLEKVIRPKRILFVTHFCGRLGRPEVPGEYYVDGRTINEEELQALIANPDNDVAVYNVAYGSKPKTVVDEPVKWSEAQWAKEYKIDLNKERFETEDNNQYPADNK